MLAYPRIDPVIFTLGPLAVRWYGLAYLAAFATAWFLGARRADRRDSPFSREQFQEILALGMLGAVLGARLGYVLFYKPMEYLTNPSEILALWHGGMSFHGGLLGAICAVWWLCRKFRVDLLRALDFFAPLTPPGLFFGRLGNFINAELWGRPTDAPWGMIFPGGGPLPRHPSQLYEAGLEGLLLFIILWRFSSRERARGSASGLFALLYGSFRLLVEAFREPDRHLGFILGDFVTMGMLLSLPMILAGLLLLRLPRKEAAPGAQTRLTGRQPGRKAGTARGKRG
ncbi:MAG: prolipoprotein diacylglyceryl transferase [Desulfovibrionaceae bacterium]|nr:prolipoprotein diacylglyceryl transferase [Desulfovibrionaceae bacterium]